MKIEEIEAKSILVASKLPDTDYVVNPYTGCQFGCLYCYATFMGRFVGEPRSNWGDYVYVKANAVSVIRSELERWSPEKRQASVLLSSVTDPYQGVESKYQLTRGILQAFVDIDYPGLVSILTKSPMVMRDVDLLKQLRNAEVGLTITTTDDTLSRFLEVSAPSASRRLDTLRELNQEGIATYVFVGPLLPHFRYYPELLDELFGAIAKTGNREVYVEHINLPGYIKDRLWQTMRQAPEEVQDVYRGAKTPEHREILSNMISQLLDKHNLHIRLGGTIYHQELSNKEKETSLVGIRDTINRAISTNGVVQISYEDFHGNVTQRIITPLEWSDFDEQKLRAYCHLRQDERSFSVSRMQYAKYGLSPSAFAKAIE